MRGEESAREVRGAERVGGGREERAQRLHTFSIRFESLSSFSFSLRLRGFPLCPPELTVRTPAHTKQLGWCVEFESRVTHRARFSRFADMTNLKYLQQVIRAVMLEDSLHLLHGLP